MEELRKKLDQIKYDLQVLEDSTSLLKRQANILGCMDRVYKEVV